MAGSLGFVPESVNLCACVLYDGMCCFFLFFFMAIVVTSNLLIVKHVCA
jgi:hypothetical protein